MSQIPYLTRFSELMVKLINWLDDNMEKMVSQLWPDCPDMSLEDMCHAVADNATTGVFLGV
jgi:hypothetical protein